MKRLTALIMALMLCFAFAACNKETAQDPATPPAAEDNTPKAVELLTIQNSDGKAIGIKDTREDAIKAWGEPTSERTYAMIYEGATVFINDTVNMITVTDKGYKGYGDAQIGMSVDEFMKGIPAQQYYKDMQEDIGYLRLTFAVDVDGKLIPNPDYATSLSSSYLYIVTSNNYNEEGTITHIQLKDNTGH